MTNILKYQGYTARIEFDVEDGVFVGHVLGIADRISFHGKSVAELTDAFHAAVDHYLEDCRATGRHVEDNPKRNRSELLGFTEQDRQHIRGSLIDHLTAG